MVLNIIPVGTITPRVISTQLHANTPSDAVNADNIRGCLSPRAGVSKTANRLTKASDLKTVIRISAQYIAWDDVVDVVLAQADVTGKRFYFTGDTNLEGPRQSNAALALAGGDPSTYPTTTRPLGIAAPPEILTVTEHGTPDEKLDDKVISYVFTYVTDWGEESAPTEVSPVSTVVGGKYTAVEGIVDPQIDYIKYYRFYRVETGTSGEAEYLAIAVRPGSIGANAIYDVPVGTVTGPTYKLYDSNSKSSPTGLNPASTEVCPSENWLPPPVDLKNLTQYLNGVLIGSSGNTLCVSEPMIPYAWPVEYQYKFEHNIVALGVVNSVIVVLTDAYPFVVDGTQPASMIKKRVEDNKKCVSKRGVVNTQAGVIYPSPAGLHLVTASGDTVNLTENIYTPEQWDALSPENLIGFLYDNKYIGFFSGSDEGIIVRLDGQQISVHPFDLGVNISGGMIWAATNSLWLIGEYTPFAYYLYTWEAGSDLTYTWESKTFVSHPTNYAVMQIKGAFDAGAVTVTLTTDGTEGTPFTISSENFKWLPSGTLYRALSLKVSGKSTIDQILLAHSPEELLDVGTG